MPALLPACANLYEVGAYTKDGDNILKLLVDSLMVSSKLITTDLTVTTVVKVKSMDSTMMTFQLR